MKGFFVTGIGTGVGKTVASAILVEALKADYWKPVQAGDLDFTDTDFIREYTINHQQLHSEAYTFQDAVSPYLAAKNVDKVIDIQNLKIPKTNNHLIVEGAGGFMVPLTENLLIKDLVKKLQFPVILISMNYLGSINHTLLTIQALKHENVEVAGIIFNGEPNAETENYILNYTRVKLLGKIPKAEIMSKGFIVRQAEQIKKNLIPLLSGITEQQTTTDLPIDYESF